MEYKDILKKKNILGSEADPIRILPGEEDRIQWQKDRISKLKEAGRPGHWAEIGVVFDDPYIVILRDLVEFPGGYRSGYLRIYNRAYLEGGAAGVVTLPEKDEKILLMHQFRHATRSWHWEIPRGFGEPGVSAAEQARAELREEIGVEAAELVDLGSFHNNTGLEGNPIQMFLARVMGEVSINEATGADELRWVSVQELETMIANAEVTDGFTIAAYTKAKLRKLI